MCLKIINDISTKRVVLPSFAFEKVAGLDFAWITLETHPEGTNAYSTMEKSTPNCDEQSWMDSAKYYKASTKLTPAVFSSRLQPGVREEHVGQLLLVPRDPQHHG